MLLQLVLLMNSISNIKGMTATLLYLDMTMLCFLQPPFIVVLLFVCLIFVAISLIPVAGHRNSLHQFADHNLV